MQPHRKHLAFTLGILSLLSCLIGRFPAQGATMAFWRGGPGFWSASSNWTSHPLVPNNGAGQTFDVIVTNGSVWLDQDVTIDSLRLELSPLRTTNGTFRIIVNGPFTNLVSHLSGPGEFHANGGFFLNGFNPTLRASTIINRSTGAITASRPLFESGARLINEAAANLELSYGPSGGTPHEWRQTGLGNSFSNAGTVTKTFTGGLTIYVTFDTTGLVDVQTGSLLLARGGIRAGRFHVNTNATLAFYAETNTFSANAEFSGAGTLKLGSVSSIRDPLSGNQFQAISAQFLGPYGFGGTTRVERGTVKFNAPPLFFASMQHIGGNLEFNGDAVAADWHWEAGTHQGPGKTTVTNRMTWRGSPFFDSSEADKILWGRTVENRGTMLASGGGSIHLFQGGRFINAAGATLEINARILSILYTESVGISSSGVAISNVVENHGTIVKTGDGFGFIHGTPFTNLGVIRVEGGTFSVEGDHRGSYYVTNGATLGLAGGTLYPSTPITGGGAVLYERGKFLVQPGYTFSGSNRLSGSHFTILPGPPGPVTIGANGTFHFPKLVFEASGFSVLGDLINHGTLYLGHGGFFVGSSANFTNFGSFVLDGATLNISNRFLNRGTMELNLGSHHVDGGILLNEGNLLWRSGTLSLENSGVFSNRAQVTFSDTNFPFSISVPFGQTGYGYNGGTMVKTGNQQSSMLLPFENAGDFEVLAGSLNLGDFVQRTGTFRLQNAGLTLFGSGLRIEGGEMLASGSITGLVSCAALISPGLKGTAGQLSFRNNLGGSIGGQLTLEPSAELWIDLEEKSSSIVSDQINLPAAALAGNLRISLSGSHRSITSNLNFTLIEAPDGGGNEISGVFRNVAPGQRLATVDGFGSFVVNYGPASPHGPLKVVLTNFERVPGSFILGDAAKSGAGLFSATVFGTPSTPYVIEISTDLQSWLPFRTNTASVSGLIEFSDPAPDPLRFYRARHP